MSNRPRLNPHCKLLFLGQALNGISKREWKSSQFLKFLITNNDYLRASRHFRIYSFGFVNYGKLSETFLYFSTKFNDDLVPMDQMFKATLNSTKALLHFLQPKQTIISLYDHFYSDDFPQRLADIFSTSNSKFCLYFWDRFSTHYVLLNSLASRLSKLQCPVETLIDGLVVPLNLELCKVNRTNKDQLASLLNRHVVKQLSIGINRPIEDFENVPTQQDLTISSKNIRILRHLEVSFFRELNTQPLFSFLSANNVQLTTLQIKGINRVNQLANIEAIISEIHKNHRQFVDMTKESENFARKLVVFFTLSLDMSAGIEFGDVWITKLLALDLFRNAKYEKNRRHEFKGRVDDERLDFDFRIYIFEY